MKVLFYTKYSRKGASSRLRSHYLADFMKDYSEVDLKISIFSLFNDSYLECIYAGRKVNILSYLRFLLLRGLTLIHLVKADLVFVEKEFFPYVPFLDELIFYLYGKKIIIDFDDAIFENYTNGLFKKLVYSKFTYIVKSARLVTVGSDYLFHKMRSFNASDIYFIPTTFTETLKHESREGSKDVVVGWIGTPKTSAYLLTYNDIFKKLEADFNIRFVAIGAAHSDWPFEIIDWNEKTEKYELGKIDIGIMPLPDAPFERGKCAYKLIQYMSVGIPFVASGIGENIIVSAHGGGMLADNRDDWYNCVRELCSNVYLRQQMGLKNKDAFKAIYERKVVFSKFLSYLSLVGD